MTLTLIFSITAHANFMNSDLWGADGTQNSSAPYPGDNGDWTSWDDYLTQWILDMNANHATAGLSIDIWNEPDLTFFWNAPQAQYIQMWGRTWHRLRLVVMILLWLTIVSTSWPVC
jgi:hypothetical protein